MLSPDELSEIERFVLFAGKNNLYEYLQLERTTPENEKLAALDTKRNWAQGQQSNPKYRQEAIWLLKNQSLCQRALTSDSEPYLEYLGAKEIEQKALALLQYVQGVIAGGHLTNRGLQTIQHKAMTGGLSITQMNDLVEKALEDEGAARVTGPDPQFVDYYELLSVHATADLAEIETAYRNQYDTCRRMADTRNAQQRYAELDQAWDVLGDHEGRIFFDSLRSLQTQDQDPIPAENTARPALRGVPGAMHRSPGELEKEISPASTEGIGYAHKIASPPTTEGLPPPSANELRPAKTSAPKTIRFSPAAGVPDPPKAMRPKPVPEQRSKPKAQPATKPARIPLSSKRGISPGIIVALLILIGSALVFYWTVMQ